MSVSPPKRHLGPFFAGHAGARLLGGFPASPRGWVRVRGLRFCRPRPQNSECTRVRMDPCRRVRMKGLSIGRGSRIRTCGPLLWPQRISQTCAPFRFMTSCRRHHPGVGYTGWLSRAMVSLAAVNRTKVTLYTDYLPFTKSRAPGGCCASSKVLCELCVAIAMSVCGTKPMHCIRPLSMSLRPAPCHEPLEVRSKMVRWWSSVQCGWHCWVGHGHRSEL